MAVTKAALLAAIQLQFMTAIETINAAKFTANGTPAFEGVATAFPNSRSEKFVDFNGTTDYFIFDASTDLSMDSGIISFWLKPDFAQTDATQRTMLNTRPTGDDGIYYYFQPAFDDWSTSIQLDGTMKNTCTTVGETWSADDVLHIVILWSSTRGLDNSKAYALYINNVLKVAASTTWNAVGASHSANSILGAGSATPTYLTDGGIFDFAALDYDSLALNYTDVEIVQALYDNSATFGGGTHQFTFDITSTLPTPGLTVAGRKVRIQTNTGVTATTAMEIDADQVTTFNNKVCFTQTDGNEYIDSLTEDELDLAATTSINAHIDGTEQLQLFDGKLAPATDNDIDLGDSTHEYKNIHIDGIAYLDEIQMDDSEKIRLGTGQDVDIYYNGTSMYIESDKVAASDINIDCGTDKTVVLVETVWNDIQFNIETGKVSASNYPDWDASFTTNTGCFKFDVNDYIDLGSNEVPHTWKEGTLAYPHIHVALDGANSSGNSQFAKFTVYLAYADVNEAFVETNKDVEIEIPNGTADLTHLLGESASLDLSSVKIGAHINIRLKRIAATSGNEYPNDIYVTQVGIHIENDTLGSRGITTK